MSGSQNRQPFRYHLASFDYAVTYLLAHWRPEPVVCIDFVVRFHRGLCTERLENTLESPKLQYGQN